MTEMTHRLLLNGKEIMKGDERSINVVFFNITGRNFNNKGYSEYQQYLQHMSFSLDVAFHGTLEVVDASGKKIKAFKFSKELCMDAAKDTRPWAMNAVDWVAFAEKGQFRPKLEAYSIDKNGPRSVVSYGEICRYPLEDIAHFYGRRQGLFDPEGRFPTMELMMQVELAHREYIEDAIADGKNVPEWLKKELGL